MIIARNQESVSMTNGRAKKGASRAAPTNKKMFERVTLAKVLLLSSLTVSALVFYGSYTAVQTVLDVPVNQVDVEGGFQYLAEGDVHQVINNYVVNGFVSVDLKKLRAELLELPWVHKASVKRKLPSGLLVTLVEQKPVAFWNNDGMINDANELFFPSRLPEITGLPHLKGKNHKAVLVLFGELAREMPVAQQPLKTLAVSDSNVVHVVTNAGATLIFNGADLVEKMRMWKAISAGELGTRLNEVDYVDLRYSNGAAVKWKGAVEIQGKKKTGGV